MKIKSNVFQRRGEFVTKNRMLYLMSNCSFSSLNINKYKKNKTK